MRSNHVVRSLASSTLVLFSASAFASGFSIFEQGAKATGMAGAFSATADDPSAIFYNVAGLAHQRRTQAMAGATIITFDAQFEGADDSYPFGGKAWFEDHTFTPPSMYAIIPIGDNATFGIGQFTAFGLRTDWADNETFPGRFIASDTNLKTASIQPSFAMKTRDGRFAWGAGIEYRTSHVTLSRYQAAINPFTQRIADVARIRLDSDWSDGWGWNLGVMYRPNTAWSIGLNYRSELEIEYDGDATFTQIPTGFPQFDAIVASQLPPAQAITTSLTYPAFAHLGVATTRWDGWTVEFDTVYQSWSNFDQLFVEFAQTPQVNLVVPQEWDDSFSFRLGGNREVTENWDIRLGALYDQTPQPLESMGPLLPDADRVAVTYGLGYEGEHWFADFAHMILIFDDRDTAGQNRDNFNGEYSTTANLVGVNLGYRF